MDFEEARQFALSLPEVTEEPHFHLLSFRVQKKIFATVPPERTHLHIFVDEHQSRSWADQDPGTYEALTWGKKLAGLRVDLSSADPKHVCELLRDSWKRKAPPRLAGQLKAPGKAKTPAPAKAPRQARPARGSRKS